MRVAVLGVGLMGRPMAQRLCAAGHEVHVWNRTHAKAMPLADHGAIVHTSAADAVRMAELTITMLEDGAVVEDVLFAQGVASAMPAGSLLVDMSSIQPAQARDHAKRLAQFEIRYLDAPVSGGTLGAEQGNLAIMVGGSEADLDSALPVLNVLGRATRVGGVGTGQLAKLANQMIVGITIGAVAEALLLCERGGADPAKVRQAMQGGFADSRILQVHGQRMVERDFAARGRMTVQRKDLRNALQTAGETKFEAPITALLEQLYSEAIDQGFKDLDQSALFAELARRNGMA
jgi:3-hydroxyisobutyrate dehydrogenase-like beta-hydroxyacid dehydrogenase